MTTNILIVEDESILALDIEDILTSSGYEVIAIASCADEAIAALANGRPDLILMDVQICGSMDGIELATHIWHRFQIPVLFLTASTDEGTMSRMKAFPGKGYVPKPFQINQLLGAIATALTND